MNDHLTDQVAAWSAEFQQARPCVPAGLALGLWHEWCTTRPGQRFLESEEQDVALILHARAHGAVVPEPGDNCYEGELLQDRALALQPLVPPPLSWGPRGNLSPERCVAVDSPVMDVCVFREGGQPVLVLVFGEGLPEIRAQVLPLVFMASLRIGTLPTDHVNVGSMRVEVPIAGWSVGLDLPVNVLGPYKDHVPAGDAAATIREALGELVRDLQNLERRTGLVRMHSADYAAYQRLDERFRGLVANTVPGEPVIWAPGYQSGRGNGAVNEATGLLLPYLRLPRGGHVQLEFHGDLLISEAYRQLEEAFRNATLEHVRADAEARLDYHEREVERLQIEHDEYQQTQAEDRLDKYGPTVSLTHRYDPDADTVIRLAFPLKEGTEKFYLEIVPSQIDNHRGWAQRLRRILASIYEAVSGDTAPVTRLAASRFIDAALRGRHPDESQSLKLAFTRWCDQVQPMLCWEWRQHLIGRNLNAEEIFTRHTIFQAGIIADGNAPRRVFSAPLSLFDQLHSAVLFDQQRGVVVIQDPTDYARQVTEPEEPMGLEPLRELADRQGTTGNDFDEALLAALRKAPGPVAEQLLNALGATPRVEDQPALDEAVAVFEGRLGAALEAVALQRKMRYAMTAMGVGAIQTTRAHLSFAENSYGEGAARAKLLLAIAEYLASGGDPDRAAAAFTGTGPAPGRLCIGAIEDARARDRDYTEQWLELFGKTRRLGQAIAALLRGLPDAEPDPDLQAPLRARTAAEAARLARDLDEAAALLADDGEPGVTALAKLGQPLEGTFLAECAGGARPGAIDLAEILTGQERPRLEGG